MVARGSSLPEVRITYGFLHQVAEHGEAAMKFAEHWEREARRQAAFAAAAGSAELEAELQELRARVITLNKDLIALESTVTMPKKSLIRNCS